MILGKVPEKKEKKDSMRKLGGNGECILLNLCRLPVVILDDMIISRTCKKGKMGLTLSPPFFMLYFLQKMGNFMRQVVEAYKGGGYGERLTVY